MATVGLNWPVHRPYGWLHLVPVGINFHKAEITKDIRLPLDGSSNLADVVAYGKRHWGLHADAEFDYHQLAVFFVADDGHAQVAILYIYKH